jgi:hypothetical protein
MSEESESMLRDLKDNTEFERIETEPAGEPEPHCLSSVGEFKHRGWECFARWKYILLPCC